MLANLKEQLQDLIAGSVKKHFSPAEELPGVEIDVPSDKKHGDFSTNIALKSAKLLKKPPMELAQGFLKAIQSELAVNPLGQGVEKVEIKNPGFINFFLSNQAAYDILAQVFQQRENFGRSSFGQKEKLQIEFVSANPTGPLSVAHARQAAVGDALANILNFIGFDAKKEFYVNDEGNQINILGQSIQCRALQQLGENVPFLENGYQGEYIVDMALEFIRDNHVKNVKQLKEMSLAKFIQFGVEFLMAVIKQELNDFGVYFDVWAHQSKIATPENIEKVLALLREKGFLYEKDGALWFRSTDFGDDKDRVLKKSDGNYTYFTPDIAYHSDKFQRGFKRVFNMWGPDHHGYIPRLKAAVQALGYQADAVQVLIVQLATIYRSGQAVSMSTRRGQYISLREVLNEVGKDAARFFFLMRHIEAHLDFDLELAKKETPENPVYYIQYAHARIHSIKEKAKEIRLALKESDWQFLSETAEVDLIKKIGNFPEVLIVCSRQMDPFTLVTYLQELATCFHKFYDQHRVVDSENPALSNERLALIDAVRIVLGNGLRLLGVSAPTRM